MGTFDGVIDEIGRATASWEPVNGNDEAAFEKVRRLLAEVPAVFEALADGLKTMAGKSTDSILFAAAAADLLGELETYARAPVEPVRDAAAGVDSAHGADLERIQGEDPRIAAFDWSRNRDVS